MATPKPLTALMLCTGLIVIGFSVHPGISGGFQESPGSGSSRFQGTEQPPGRVDAYGDELPVGARLRLGTVRFQHGKSIESAALSPDGKLLVTGGTDTLRVWETTTGRALVELEDVPMPRGFGDARWFVAISPDGKTLACGVEDGDVRFWELATGRALPSLETASGPKPVVLPAKRLGGISPTSPPQAIRAIAYSPDGKRLATTTEKGPVRIWELATRREVMQLPAAGALVQFSPNGRNLVIYGENIQTPVLVSAVDGKRLVRFPHDKESFRVAFSPDGGLLATVCSEDLAVRLWKTTTGHLLHTLVHPAGEGRSNQCTAVAFSPNGRLLATATWDGIIRLWDPASGKEQRSLNGHDNAVTGLLFAPDGRMLYSVSWDKSAKRWDLATGQELPVIEDAGRHSRVALSRDGRLLASSGGRDGMVYLTDASTGRRLHALAGHRGYVGVLTFSPDGKLLASGGQDQLTRLWDTASGRLVRTLGEPKEQAKNEVPTINSLAFAPDGTSLLTVRTFEGKARLWEVATGNALAEIPQPRAARVAYAPDGRTVAVGASYHLTVSLWDLTTDRQLQSIAAATNSLEFSPDSNLLATCEHSGTVRLWNTRTGREARNWQCDQGVVWSVAFTPGGLELLSGGADGTLRLWDAATGKELARWNGHRGWVLQVSCSRDGLKAVSGSMDNSALVWDLRPARQELPASGAAALWEELAAGGVKAYRAGWALADHPAEALGVFKERLKPVTAVDREQVERLITSLNISVTRDEAFEKLAGMGETIIPQIREALQGVPNAEARRCLQTLLDQAEAASTSPKGLQTRRAVRALESIATPEAQRLLKELGTGAPQARLTQEVKAALQRMAR